MTRESPSEATAEMLPLSALDFELLLEASRALSSELRLPELLENVIALAARVVKAETGSLLLSDGTEGNLRFYVALGAARHRLAGATLKPGEGIAGWVASHLKPQIVNNVRSDPRWASHTDAVAGFETRQVVAVPLLRQGRCLGVVEGINKRDGSGFTPSDRRALEIFASQVAVAVENARLFENLTGEKERLAALFREMSDGALVLDARGDVVFLNDAGARWMGTRPLNGGPRPWREVTVGFVVRSEKAGDGGVTRVELSRASGRPLILGGVSQPLLDGRGALLLFHDVTNERREERMKRSFLSLVSHKLRTPLSVITGYAPLLQQEKNLSPMAQRGLVAIESQGRRLASLVEKLLRFTELERDDLLVVQEPISVRKEIDAALLSLGDTVTSPGVFVERGPSLETAPDVLADVARFRDVICHLVENAVKFNPAPDKRVWLNAGADEGFVSVMVEDNGPGIPPEERPHLFQKFHQIEEGFTGQVEGAGLGLALCKRLVEAHGGRLTVDVSPRGGALFVARWPRAPRP